MYHLAVVYPLLCSSKLLSPEQLSSILSHDSSTTPPWVTLPLSAPLQVLGSRTVSSMDQFLFFVTSMWFKLSMCVGGGGGFLVPSNCSTIPKCPSVSFPGKSAHMVFFKLRSVFKSVFLAVQACLQSTYPVPWLNEINQLFLNKFKFINLHTTVFFKKIS